MELHWSLLGVPPVGFLTLGLKNVPTSLMRRRLATVAMAWYKSCSRGSSLNLLYSVLHSSMNCSYQGGRQNKEMVRWPWCSFHACCWPLELVPGCGPVYRRQTSALVLLHTRECGGSVSGGIQAVTLPCRALPLQWTAALSWALCSDMWFCCWRCMAV